MQTLDDNFTTLPPDRKTTEEATRLLDKKKERRANGLFCQNPSKVKVKGMALVPRFGELVLGCIEADVCKYLRIFATFVICSICAFVHRAKFNFVAKIVCQSSQ